MKGLKKGVKIVLIVIAVLVAVLLLLCGLFVYELDYAVRTVDEEESPDGKYKLLLQSVGSPMFFSSADGKLVLKKGRKKVAVHEFTLSDDGGAVKPDVWKVLWRNDSVEVIISGSEQDDELIKIGYDGSSKSEYLDTQRSEFSENDTSEPDTLAPEETIPEEAAPEEQQIIDGYQAVYNTYFKEQGGSYIEDYNAKGYLRIILYEDDSEVKYLVYDRPSANGKCGLYVYYSSPKDETGAWSPTEASILDIYAYVYDTGDVIRSGEKSWEDTGEKLYRSVTGE